jgi:hypothetical protein
VVNLFEITLYPGGGESVAPVLSCQLSLITSTFVLINPDPENIKPTPSSSHFKLYFSLVIGKLRLITT